MRAWLAVIVLLCAAAPTSARDDGRFAGSPLKEWFDGLRSDNGLCCSFADGVSVQDVDWDTDGVIDDVNSGYRVRLETGWIDVPKAAVIKEPNKFGSAVVWPFKDMGGGVHVRCFMPGTQG